MMNMQRGFGMLGLVALIALLGTLCAAASVASMRSATGSVRGIQRLRAQAAAEGAAVLLAAGEAPTSGTLMIGDCHIAIAAEDATTSSTAAAHVTVELLAGTRTVFSRNYRATSDGSGAKLKVLP